MTILSLLVACAESETLVEDGPKDDDSNIIHIGGVQNTGLEMALGTCTTRATGDNAPVDAETVDWLLAPLFGGLDITYGAKGKPETEKVAILRLLKKEGATGNTADDIKYSQYSDPDGEKIAEYSFKYRTDTGEEGDDATWYDNGLHYFQGVYVPDRLRYIPARSETLETVNGASSTKAPLLKTDQSKDGVNDNYTLLERYLGMPADANIHATVGRVKLPFRHRLARVQAYVLIDPSMGPGVTIKGYQKDQNGKDDATSSEIRFCNVKVLAGVKETDDPTSGHATLTPQWDEARKVIPHFVNEYGSVDVTGAPVKNPSTGTQVDVDHFIMYYEVDTKTYIFPAKEQAWLEAHNAWNAKYNAAPTNYTDAAKEAYANEQSGYERTKYGKVPCYDIIVRPTYKTQEMVMYDEDLTGTSVANLANLKNSIHFEITLNNGLQYEKNFEFDLDANYQTIVYLRINREHIDYNSSGAEVWNEDTNHDGYYGVNNQNGNTLSFAGSSWQRAYRIGSTNPGVTDGHYYGQDDATDDDKVQDDDQMPWYPQYVDQTKWLNMFAKAHEGGLHHGDYFILDQDITIDAKLLPDDFVFTGHLDGQDHWITLTGMGEKVVDQAAWDEDNYVHATEDDYSAILYVEDNGSYAVYSMPTLYVKVHHDAVDATYYESVADYNEGHNEDPDFTSLNEEQFKALTQEQKIKTQAVDAYDEYVLANPQPSIAEMLAGEFYVKVDEGNYSLHHPTLYANHIIHHDEISHLSGSTLFAGLNGAYEASVGVANVHSETQNGHTVLVPYVDTESKTGWRAEVINTKIAGADMFPESVIKADGTYDVDKVSGYIYNCWKGSEKIKSHTPTLPKYK